METSMDSIKNNKSDSSDSMLNSKKRSRDIENPKNHHFLRIKEVSGSNRKMERRQSNTKKTYQCAYNTLEVNNQKLENSKREN
jgi:hypothetical protein